MSNLSPKDRDRIAQLDSIVHRVRHANALVEQFASSPKDGDQLTMTLRRTFSQLKMRFTTAGFDRLALMCSSLEQAARRGMSHGPKAATLREGVGGLSRQMEIDRRGIMTTVQRDQPNAE
jgi:hypothetical protein